jgi:UDP-N-acetylmuramyl pentapeptide synthase
MPKERVAEAAVDEVAGILEPWLDGAVVLVKASRGVALEKVVAALTVEAAGPAFPPGPP